MNKTDVKKEPLVTKIISIQEKRVPVKTGVLDILGKPKYRFESITCVTYLIQQKKDGKDIWQPVQPIIIQRTLANCIKNPKWLDQKVVENAVELLNLN